MAVEARARSRAWLSVMTKCLHGAPCSDIKVYNVYNVPCCKAPGQSRIVAAQQVSTTSAENPLAPHSAQRPANNGHGCLSNASSRVCDVINKNNEREQITKRCFNRDAEWVSVSTEPECRRRGLGCCRSLAGTRSCTGTRIGCPVMTVMMMMMMVAGGLPSSWRRRVDQCNAAAARAAAAVGGARAAERETHEAGSISIECSSHHLSQHTHIIPRHVQPDSLL